MNLSTVDWNAVRSDLDEVGCALTPPLLDPEWCRSIAALYDRTELFRSTVDMERYRFGRGQYRYFADPVPEPVAALRAAFWPYLLPIARDWAERLGRDAPWPDEFADWLATCHAAGQTRPVRSARGWSAAPVRHGVSPIRSGRRHTLGLVLHDAT